MRTMNEAGGHIGSPLWGSKQEGGRVKTRPYARPTTNAYDEWGGRISLPWYGNVDTQVRPYGVVVKGA